MVSREAKSDFKKARTIPRVIEIVCILTEGVDLWLQFLKSKLIELDI